MKKYLKRISGILCAAVLAISGVASGWGLISSAGSGGANGTQSFEIFSSDTGVDIVDAGGGAWFRKDDASVNLPQDLQKNEYLTLNLKVNLADQSAVKVMNNCIVELANNNEDQRELWWSLDSETLQTGDNTIVLKLALGSNQTGSSEQDGSGRFDLAQTVKFFRIYSDPGKADVTSAGSIKLKKVELKNIRGMAFDDTDTYLQLQEPLEAVPETIEASVKMDSVAQETETTDAAEWTLISAGTDMNQSVERQNGHSDWSGITQSAVSGSVAALGTDGSGPAVGTPYSEITIGAHESSKTWSGGFGFYKQGISIPSGELSKYEQKDLAISFWFYNPDSDKLPTGAIGLSSANWQGNQEILWYTSSWINDRLKQGWNYIELNLGNYSGTNGDPFDYTNINYMRWYSDGGLLTTEKTVKITDVKLIAKSGNTILTAGSDFVQAFGRQDYNQTVTTGVTATEEKGLPAGTLYSKIIVHPTANGANKGGWFGFWKQNIKTQIPANSDREDLALSFWYWSDGSGFPGGAMTLTSANWQGSKGIRWYTNRPEFQIGTAGWKYVELPLDSYSAEEGTGFDYTKIDYARWYSDGTPWTVEKEIRITDMKIVKKSGKAATDLITVTKNVDTQTLSDNFMIFSNTNNSQEQAPYALFITKDGYPSLLWNGTKYTLNQDVRTDDWVDIKVMRNAEKKIEFYIDGQLVATSKDATTDYASAFTTAHCIGADGNGTQQFSGTLSNIRVYSDNGEAKTGDWELTGNIQYVLSAMPDASGNENDAVFRGTRAADWIDYDKTQYSFLYNQENEEDYWSMVFIPDIQNLTQTAHGYDETWYDMADWIAANVDKENIKHVIGAGDSGWGDTNGSLDGELTIAKNGFDKFANLVSWSNNIGNHEYNWNTTGREADGYQKYFGEDYIMSTAAANTYKGSFEDPNGISTTENSYYRFSVNGVKWMILQLEYNPRISVIHWAKEILAQHQADNVILTTHSYLNGQGEYHTTAPDYIKVGDTANGDYLGDSTEEIWNALKGYSNIKMILCGHSTNGTGAIVQKNETNANGDVVPALMINAQDMDLSENVNNPTAYYDYQALGMLSIFRFSADGSNVAIQYYAPQYEKSFSPIDLHGNRGSNAITLEFTVEQCSHQGTSLLVNQNNADVGKEGYTGDTYCSDCDSMIEKGSVIPALSGDRKPTDQNMEQTENQIDGNASPGTGDIMQPVIWMVICLLAGMTVFGVKKYKEGRKS